MRLFGETYKTIVPIGPINLLERLVESKEIVDKAIKDYDPYAVVLMLSGGDDSITALLVAKLLGLKIDFVIHGVTGTGLKDCRSYVHQVCEKEHLTLLEANAGTAFEDYV